MTEAHTENLTTELHSNKIAPQLCSAIFNTEQLSLHNVYIYIYIVHVTEVGKTLHLDNCNVVGTFNQHNLAIMVKLL